MSTKKPNLKTRKTFKEADYLMSRKAKVKKYKSTESLRKDLNL